MRFVFRFVLFLMFCTPCFSLPDESALHLAVRFKTTKYLEGMLKLPGNRELLLNRGKRNENALELALRIGRIDAFLMLLPYLENKGLRIPNRYKWTLLHMAAFYNRPTAIRALVAAGLDVNVVDGTRQRWTALDVALAENAHYATAVLRELRNQAAARSAAMAAAAATDTLPEVVRHTPLPEPEAEAEALAVEPPLAVTQLPAMPVLPVPECLPSPMSLSQVGLLTVTVVYCVAIMWWSLRSSGSGA